MTTFSEAHRAAARRHAGTVRRRRGGRAGRTGERLLGAPSPLFRGCGFDQLSEVGQTDDGEPDARTLLEEDRDWPLPEDRVALGLPEGVDDEAGEPLAVLNLRLPARNLGDVGGGLSALTVDATTAEHPGGTLFGVGPGLHGRPPASSLGVG